MISTHGGRIARVQPDQSSRDDAVAYARDSLWRSPYRPPPHDARASCLIATQHLRRRPAVASAVAVAGRNPRPEGCPFVVAVPSWFALPGMTRAVPRRRRARRDHRGAVSSDSRIVPAAAREGTVGLTSSPRASDSRPGDSFYQQRQRLRWRARRRARTRRATAAPHRATIALRTELRASDRPRRSPPPEQALRFPRTGREEDKRAEQLAHAGRRLYRGFRVFCIVRVNRRCSTTPARARALPAATRASSLLA